MFYSVDILIKIEECKYALYMYIYNLKIDTKYMIKLSKMQLFIVFMSFLAFFCVFLLNINRGANCFAYGIEENVLAEQTATSVGCDDEILFTFRYDDKIFSEKLKVREQAVKHICGDGRINHEKLVKFFETAYHEMIMPENILKFCFSNFENVIEGLCANIDREPINAQLVVEAGTGCAKLKSAKNGIEVDKNALIFSIFSNLIQNKTSADVIVKEIKPDISDTEIKNRAYKRGSFSTNYASSSADRKHNIKTALSKFDGLTLNPGQTVSFNEITGRRTAENGYKGAKIIVSGQFEEGLGGGVCQASTTLYNACLVSGLKIVEANQHSLRVGYVEPSFDAMVNWGSSDLKIMNNTDQIITFACFSGENECRVSVYGEKNDYNIVRRSEKIKVIEPPIEKIVSFDEFASLKDGNAEIIAVRGGQAQQDFYATVAKQGLKSEGYLDFYQKGELQFSQKIRQNTYAATQGVKVVKNVNNV